MATRMTDTDPAVRGDGTYARPVVWPWVVLAVVVALALWWAAANNMNKNTPSNAINSTPTVTSPVSPGTGTTPTTPAPAGKY